jgi:hypothetical protein
VARAQIGPDKRKYTAKLLDSKSLTLGSSRKQIWPVYLCHPDGARSFCARDVALRAAASFRQRRLNALDPRDRRRPLLPDGALIDDYPVCSELVRHNAVEVRGDITGLVVGTPEADEQAPL